MDGINLNPKLDAILDKDLDDLMKITLAFKYLITEHIEIAKREIELLRVLGDNENRVKEQIKANTMEYSLGVYAHCYNRVTGRHIEDDEIN